MDVTGGGHLARHDEVLATPLRHSASQALYPSPQNEKLLRFNFFESDHVFRVGRSVAVLTQ